MTILQHWILTNSAVFNNQVIAMEHIYNCTGHKLKIPDIVDSQGIYIFDSNGNRYMDLESGTWSTSLGHNNKTINSVINKQINILMHTGFCYSAEILEESAKSVLDITKFENGKCVFLCSGSEAIEVSRQIARHLTDKRTSMTLHDSYLGAYASVTNRSKDWYVFNWEQCQTCRNKMDCDPSCEELRKIPEDISDFVFEPGSSSGFVRFPPKSMIQNIVRIVRNNKGKINDLISKAKEKGMKFLTLLNSLIDNKTVLAVRGRGLMFAVDIINKEVAETIHSALIEHGYIVCNRGDSFRIDPPLIITESEFNGFVDFFKSVIRG